jgi:hypothetical protein
MTSTLEDNLYEPQVIVLGIFGNTNKIKEHELHDNVLIPLLKVLERIPDKVLLPSEGNSSIYIQEWAESLHVKTQTFYADWIRNGRIAQIIRDDRIFKECTHALVFLSQKSNKLEKFAEKMTRKEKKVFTLSIDQTLTQLELSHEPMECHKASKHAHKLDKGIKQMWQKYQMKEEH